VALHAQTYGESVDTQTLIPHMLEAFMAGDRGFRKANAIKPGGRKSSGISQTESIANQPSH